MQNNQVDTSVFDIIGVEIPNPGTGNNLSFLVPVNTRIQPISFSCTVIILGATDPRVMQVAGHDGSVNFSVTANPLAMATTQTHFLQFALGSQLLDHFSENQHQYAPMADDMILRFGDSFVAELLDLQAGDAIIDPVLRYKQWIVA